MSPLLEASNKEELETLQWLDENFFERVLRHSEQELDAELVVQSVQLSPATKKGDHYTSVIWRAEVKYRQGGVKGTKRMILKTMPKYDEASYQNMLVGKSQIFETEIGMYTEVLPRFERILRSIGDTTVLKPNCLYHSLSPRKLIICEDLVPLGYQPVDDGPMNIAEAKCAYMKLAKWHAISYKLILEDPHCFDTYRHSFLATPNIMEMDFMTTGIDNFIEMLQSMPEFHEYVPYFNGLQKDLFKKFIDCYTEYIDPTKGQACYVLCHGDYSYKNIMVKRNPHTKELIDVIPLDFQYSFVGNVACDVLFSFFMLLDANLRQYYHELLYFYFTHFTTTLKLIGYHGPKPKIMEMHKEIKKLKSFELFGLVTCLPMRHALSRGDFDTELFVCSEEYRKNLYKNEDYIQELRELLPIYKEEGYLEE